MTIQSSAPGSVLVPSRAVQTVRAGAPWGAAGRAMTLLPQNLILSPSVCSEDFETTTGWTCPVGTIANNTSQFKTGAQSIKLTSNVGSVWYGYAYKTVNWDLSADGWHISFWIYTHDAAAQYNGLVPYVSLCNDSGRTQEMRALVNTAWRVHPGGWTLANVAKSDFVASGGGTFSSPIIRLMIRLNAVNPNAPSTSFDALTIPMKTVPTVMFMLDDTWVSHHTKAFPYMKAFGMFGTVYVQTNFVDTAGRLSSAQLAEMAKAGWIIASHTRSHTQLAGLSEADQEAELTNAIGDLVGLGFGAYAHHYAYPFGAMTDINADTYTAIANNGTILTARNMIPVTSYEYGFLPADNLQIASSSAGSQTVATITGWIDNAITRGSSLGLVFHDIGGAAISEADFKLVVDYVVAKARAGLIYPITVDDLYRLQSGPVSVPVVG